MRDDHIGEEGWESDHDVMMLAEVEVEKVVGGDVLYWTHMEIQIN